MKTIFRIAVLAVLILAGLLAALPQRQAQSVQYTAGLPATTAHIFPQQPQQPAQWADATHYAPHSAGYRLGDCFADRTQDDLYPQPDPYCLPVPSVNTVTKETKRDTDVQIIPVTSVEPVEPVVPTETPETPVIIDNGGETVPSDPEQPAANGNPGNTKCVGNAGEDPNGRGTMPNDNAGGNGNGEHGNQGEGGNGHSH
jgi:hypothetical protein